MMNDVSSQGTLELEVENFGPIVEARIDFRPLTVFVGPSNTGKSYLAVLIYALHQFFNSERWVYGRRRARLLSGYPSPPPAPGTTGKELDALVAWLREFLAGGRRNPVPTGPVPASIAALIRPSFRISGEAEAWLGSEINRCFGIDGAEALIRRGNRQGAQVALRRFVSDAPDPFAYLLKMKASKIELESILPDETPIRIERGVQDGRFSGLGSRLVGLLPPEDLPIAGDEDETAFLVREMVSELVTMAVPHLTGPLHAPAFYLPADRTGVMHAHRVVVSALIERASLGGSRPSRRMPMLSGILADFLEQLLDLGRVRRGRRQPGRDFGRSIEEHVLGGAVRIDRSESGYPSFLYRPDGWRHDLELMSASSMVSELAPVVLYLRHVVQPGNVLIIEEPESHLHPAMQVAFMRQLAAVLRTGIRIIVTTHSEWLLEELANLVRRSQLPVGARSGNAEESRPALRQDQVGVWLFEPRNRPRGSVVREIPLDTDAGLFASGFDDVATALHNDWAELSSRIENGR